jgi:hypothetical protein
VQRIWANEGRAANFGLCWQVSAPGLQNQSSFPYNQFAKSLRVVRFANKLILELLVPFLK